MTEFEKATPRPWSGADDATPREVWSGDGNALLAEFFDTSEGLEGADATADTNARLSLRAANSFDALVAACKRSRLVLSLDIAPTQQARSMQVEEVLDLIEHALKLAGGDA